jgi:hypothetical protein
MISFSHGFGSFSKVDGSSDHSQAMSNAQLPDLLNGTNVNNNMSLDLDPKQLLKNLGNISSINNHGDNSHDDWESAFKYLKNNFNKHYEDQQQQEDWLRFQEMKKQSGMSSGFNHYIVMGGKIITNNLFFRQCKPNTIKFYFR